MRPIDECPDDPAKTAAGVCGCGVPDDDADGDGVADCIDNCEGVRNAGQLDRDEDGFGDECDVCPDDPAETQLDTDGDGVGNACDNCPAAVNEDQADSDGDGLGDVCDGCPNDAAKASPGICGCGVADIDNDGDGVLDCNDACPGTQAGVSVGADGCEDAPPSGQPVPDPNDGTSWPPGNSGQNQSNTPPVAPICGAGIAQTMLPSMLVLSFVHATRRRRR